MNKKLWLKLAGSLSLAVALFQAMIFLFPSASLYFGAAQGIVKTDCCFLSWGKELRLSLEGTALNWSELQKNEMQKASRNRK
jgi:hypothetical protein